MAFEFSDAYLVESVECSAVSRSLKTIKPRCFNVVGYSTRKVWFHKGCIIAESVLSLSRTLNRGQLSLERFKFWQLTSQLLALDVCLRDAFS
ncbi:hypothetical protein VCG_000812 [Vibrio cholerae 12129(1)]|nr:hypothetical protein VCG_000759 [Vibrio cholerae 12129(1)]EEN99587.1 hypothetical protein VCG_000812 [Vibrio cholerae 12129(1)]EEO13746.1 hypothetical protein VCB_002460 [Vibrio cholerae TMA 21]KNA44043.1 hypothetical protein A5A_023954 [Vibrio cholerae MZO-2]KNA44195.1 hypothetical protein A5A_023896 [Vibrio cholerae MZO-2]